MRKAYIFIFNGSISKDSVKAWADAEPAVLHWRTDMPNTFYLISEKEASDLSESFLAFNGRAGRFLISEASTNRQGILPSATWYLLRNKQRKPEA